LLQKLRDSANIASYVKYVSERDSLSRELSNTLYNFLTQHALNRIHIAYHRYGYLPASIMYWFILTMDPEKSVTLSDSTSSAYYILPYSEPALVVLFSSDPFSSSVLNLAQAARLLEHNLLIVTLKPHDKRVETLLSRYSVTYIETVDELEAMLTASIATYYAMSKLYSDRLGARGRRLYSHVEEGITPVVEELIERYLDRLEALAHGNKWIVTSSKMLEPAALYFTEALRRVNIESYYQVPDQVLGYENTLLLSTSVEEYTIRELRFRYNMMGVKLQDLVLNTDPLEAQIYIALLAYYLVYSLSSKQ